jgi:hypothetical protein
VFVDPCTLRLDAEEERARIAAVLDTVIAVTSLWAGSEWSRGGPRPAQEQERGAGVSPRDEAVARARTGRDRMTTERVTRTVTPGVTST